MSVPDANELIDALRRGRLNSGNQANLRDYLANHPEEQAVLEEEMALNQLLQEMPAAPVSSNFTARVLDAVDRETRARVLQSVWRRIVFGNWLPKAATAAALLCAGLLAYQQHQVAERHERARHLAELSRRTTSAPLELLQNFDAIQRLAQVPPDTDRELIEALSR